MGNIMDDRIEPASSIRTEAVEPSYMRGVTGFE